MRPIALVVALACSLASVAAVARDDAPAADASRAVTATQAPMLEGGRVADLVAWHHELQQRLDRGEYDDLSARDRKTIRHTQEKLLKELEGHVSYDEFGDAERLRIFNAHDAVLALLKGDPDDRMICEHSQRTGSRLKQVNCATASERARRARESDEFLRRPAACLDKRVCRGN